MNIIKAVKYKEKHPKTIVINKEDPDLYLCVTFQVYIKRKGTTENINNNYISPWDITSKWIIKKDANIEDYLN